MSNSLPETITRFFAAKNAADSAAVARCFAPDGVVDDEGEVHRGREAVAAWSKSTSDKYADQTEVLSLIETDDEIIVTGRVSGTFDGSPIELDFHFELSPEGITSLRTE